MTSREGRFKRRLRILRLFALEGPLNKYRAWEKLKKDKLETEPTFREEIAAQIYQGLIYAKDTDLEARGGKPSEWYDLSLYGLAILIGYYYELGESENEKRDLFRHIAKKYRDELPDVFDLWPSVTQAGVEDLAIERIQSACSDTYDSKDITVTFLDPHFIAKNFGVFAQSKWVDAVVGNTKLRDATVSYLLQNMRERVEGLSLSLKPLMGPERVTEEERKRGIGLITQLTISLAEAGLLPADRKESVLAGLSPSS